MTFRIVYVIEPHPTGATSPYSNREWTEIFSRDAAGNAVGQPESYEARMALAQKTVAESQITVPALVDTFDNPVWCTYGPAPNIAYLIDRDGTIMLRQGWFQSGEMADAIMSLLG